MENRNRVDKRIHERSQKNEKDITLPVVAGFFVLLGAFVYQFEIHPASSFLLKSLWFGLAPVIIVLLAFFASLGQKENNFELKDSWILLVVCIVVYIVGAGIYSLILCIRDFYLWLQTSVFTRRNAEPIAIVMTLVIGLVLFGIRMRLKVIYGFTEVIVGLFVAGSKIEPNHAELLSQTSFLLGLLTAGIYLVVRGLDNMHQGFTKQPYDPVVKKLKSLISKPKKEQFQL